MWHYRVKRKPEPSGRPAPPAHEGIMATSNKQEYLSVKSLAASLGIPPESIYLLLGSECKQITRAQAELVVSFHRRITAEGDAALARIKARCEARGITPVEELRECFEYFRVHYPDKTLTEALAESERKKALKNFSLAATQCITETFRPPHQTQGVPMEPFELAMRAVKIFVEEFGRLDVFTPEELEQMGLELGWIVVDEFHTTVSEEIAEVFLVHVRSKAKESVEELLAEKE
jgi:hypothetical protein